MTILKLANAGDTHTAHVTACTPEEGPYGPQVRFTFANNDLLYLPASSAHRQLLRCGFPEAEDSDDPENPAADLTAVAGNTLAFSRTESKKPGGKPYWNIAVAAPAEAKPHAAPKRLQAPTAVPGEAPPNLTRRAPPPTDDDFPFGYLVGPEPIDFSAAGQLRAAAEAPSAREQAYFALARRVAAFQAQLQKEYDIPVDGSSINAMTFSIMGD